MLILVFFIFSACFARANNEIQVNQWKNNYLYEASNTDLQIIANLIYWSFQHSKSNLESQEQSDKCFDSMWLCWQNVSQKRLDPANNNFNQTCPKFFLENAKKFSYLVEQHKIISANYCKMVKQVFESSQINDRAKEACNQMREQARLEVAKSVYFRFANELTNIVQKNINTKNLVSLLLYKLFFKGKKSFLSTWAVQTFNQINQEYNDASIICWDAFFKSQQAGNLLWQIIEQTRKDFYFYYYKAVVEILNERKIEKKFFNIIFSKDKINTLPETLS